MEKLYFVYIGSPLPKYAHASLDLAVRFSGLEVHLISNERNRNKVKNRDVKFSSIEDFYNPEEFREASKNIEFSSKFRDGFWHRSLERFFVLDQFAVNNKLDSFFHAELDQLIAGSDLLINNLRLLQMKGIFLPFHTSSSAVASVFYCNDLAALKSLLRYSRECDTFPNEMALIANWATRNPSKVFQLPTLADCLNGSETNVNSDLRTLKISQTGGVVDAAQIGQWLAGIDSRNLSIKEIPMNKYSDSKTGSLLSREQLNSLLFEFDTSLKKITISSGSHGELQVFNLHIHSKIHNWLNKSDKNLQKIFWMVNQSGESRVPGARKIQIYSFVYVFTKLIQSNPGHLLHVIKRVTGVLKD
jgi:hypothetical protein